MSLSSLIQRPTRDEEASARCASEKSPAFVGLALGLWAATSIVLGHYLWPIFAASGGVFQRSVLVGFFLLFLTFWLLGAYHIAMVVFWFIRNGSPNADKLTKEDETRDKDASEGKMLPVAVLYPTCDDFQRDAVLTCLDQDYPDFHVFILDDSRSEAYKHEVNAFQLAFPEQVTVVRRPNREGFKAGNLNHALRAAAGGFPLFAVMDADERIPPDFLRRMAAHLAESEYAFVQANHAPNPSQPEPFARMLGHTILPFWSVMLPTKGRYGFMPCIGHGLLVRRSAWEAIGGFPEVASEDLAFSAALLEKGARGVYAADVVCYEDFPTSAASFRQQQMRYIAGVFQVLVNYWPRVFRSNAPWFEKLDFGLSCLPLYIPVLCLLYLLLCAVGIPLCFGVMGHIVADTRFGVLEIPYFRLADGRFQSLWSPVFFYISILLSFSPAFPMIALAISGKTSRVWRLIVVSNLLYMSTMFAAVGALVQYMARRTIRFCPTGAFGRRLTGGGGFAGQALWETLLSVALSGMLLVSLNFGPAAIALCPVLVRLPGVGASKLQPVAAAVFMGIGAQIVLGETLRHAPALVPPLIFSIHF